MNDPLPQRPGAKPSTDGEWLRVPAGPWANGDLIGATGPSVNNEIPVARVNKNTLVEKSGTLTANQVAVVADGNSIKSSANLAVSSDKVIIDGTSGSRLEDGTNSDAGIWLHFYANNSMYVDSVESTFFRNGGVVNATLTPSDATFHKPVIFEDAVEFAVKTIATLPAASANTKKRFQVSDSATVGYRAVFSNGSAWYYEDGTAV